jgi:hypothetical protein
LLAGRLASHPADPYWSSVEMSHPTFRQVMDEVLERLALFRPTAQASLGVVTKAWLNQLRTAAPEVVQQVRGRCDQAVRLANQLRGGPGAPLPPAPDSEEFTQAMTGLLEEIDRWRGAATKQQRELTLAWLQALQGADDDELNQFHARCEEAFELSRRADAPDPTWEDACGAWSAAQVEDMAGLAETCVQHSGRYLSFLNGQYRRAKSRLLQLRPGTPTNALVKLGSSFLDYARVRQARDRLAALCRDLIPGYSGTASVTFPRLAREGLRAAASLVRGARGNKELGNVLGEARQGRDQPGPAEQALRHRRDRNLAWKQLREINSRLIPGKAPATDGNSQLGFPGLAVRGLEQAVWLITREKQHSFLTPLLNVFATVRDVDLTPVVVNYRRHLAHAACREQLAEACKHLVPGLEPPAATADLLAYPDAAARALESTAAVLDRLTQRAWLSPLVGHALAGPSGAATGGSLENLAAHCRGMDLRAALAKETQDLFPGWPAPSGDDAWTALASAAVTAFQKAIRLFQATAACDPARLAVEQFAGSPDAGGRETALATLEGKMDRARFILEANDILKGLRTFLADDELRKPLQDAFAGKPISGWADRLEDGMNGLQALINLDADRRARSGRAGDLLNALEEYEKAREQGQRVPASADVLPADRHGEWWEALLFYSAATEWQARCRVESPLLDWMTPEVHAGRVAELRRLLSRKRTLESQVIRQRWLSRQLQVANEPWARMFPERRPRGAPSLSLRDAIDKSWDRGLRHLRPCWLVSPTVASQILPLEQGQFDLVIFDEASQCPVEQAVPAIYRGKILLIAGDEKQLPPTTFFAGALQAEALPEAEDEEADDVEQEADARPAEAARRRSRRSEDETLTCTNLLELGISKLKQLYLSVHYRSDHPALIEFSNQAFYKGQLESPPAQRVSIEGHRPIEYHAVGGRYVDRTNPTEARKVVEYLEHAWQQPGAPTYGVVTFNQAQRDLIEDLIEEKCQRDPQFQMNCQAQRQRTENEQDVGFFVKNLENVQGDERDVMIFSTAFGYNEEGRFYRRFGPVALAGGHRRLNVAVTRARKRIVVMSSMPVEEIADRAAQASGELTPAGYLQLYLEYARAVSSGDDAAHWRILNSLNKMSTQAQRKPEETPLEREVRGVLKQAGHDVIRGVGSGVFAVDLGVLHRNPKQGFVLGIDCDAGSRRAERPARIDEVWRDQVLSRRGWRLHRIWSDSWRMNRDAEVRRLLAALPPS